MKPLYESILNVDTNKITTDIESIEGRVEWVMDMLKKTINTSSFKLSSNNDYDRYQRVWLKPKSQKINLQKILYDIQDHLEQSEITKQYNTRIKTWPYPDGEYEMQMLCENKNDWRDYLSVRILVNAKGITRTKNELSISAEGTWSGLRQKILDYYK